MAKYSRELMRQVRSERELAFDLKSHIERAVPFDFTFIDLDRETARRVERIMAENFARWSETWIMPIADELAVRAGVPLTEFKLGDTNARKYARGEKG